MQHFALTEKEKGTLIKMARNELCSLFSTPNHMEINEEELSPALLTPCGAFTSLYVDHKLRGCIGNFKDNVALHENIKHTTQAAALNDHRFKPLQQNEIDQVQIELSVLTPMIQIQHPDELVKGQHGIFIKQGAFTGTYLPQVWTNNNWTAEEFVSHCSKHKAQIGVHGWKNAELFSYEAIVVREQDFNK